MDTQNKTQREIRFRAWDKLRHTVNDVACINWVDGYALLWKKIGSSRATYGAELNSIQLMRYTGLKDKNGTEIYEGDIVKGNLYIGNDVCVVKWGNYSVWGAHDEVTDSTDNIDVYGWYFDWMDNETIKLNEDTALECEVIGSIYENPELLEVKEK